MLRLEECTKHVDINQVTLTFTHIKTVLCNIICRATGCSCKAQGGHQGNNHQPTRCGFQALHLHINCVFDCVLTEEPGYFRGIDGGMVQARRELQDASYKLRNQV